MKNLSKRYIISTIILVIIVVGFPFVMDRWIIGNSVYSNISNQDWVAFLGSYVGGILGGIFTFIGVKVTLYKTCGDRHH